MLRSHAPEETIGMALGITLVVLAAVTAIRVLVALVLSFGRDIRTWWKNRHPARGWQPEDHLRGPRGWLWKWFRGPQ